MKNKKKGFTLVELLVVIAILAILAAVSVVGYLAFTEKAKESNDISLTTQMNTVLQANEAQDKSETMSDVVSQLDEAGLGIEKLTPTSSGYSFVWDKETNRIFLLDEEKKVVSPEGASLSDNTENIMAIVHDGDELNTWSEANYGVYLASGFPTTELPDSLEKAVSFDAGELTLDEITISFLDDKDIYIAGNYDTLTISAASAGVDFYGDATFVNATTAYHSLHVYGHIQELTLKQGKVVVKANAEVNTIDAADATDDSSINVETSGVVGAVISSKENIVTGGNIAVTNPGNVVAGFAGGVGTEASPYLINDGEQFLNIKTLETNMKDGNSFYFKLINDIDLSKTQVDSDSISNYFCGTLDGNNHKLVVNDSLDYIFKDNVDVVNIFNLNYYIGEKVVLLSPGFKIDTENKLILKNVDYFAKENSFPTILGVNGGIIFPNVGCSYNDDHYWTEYHRNIVSILDCDVYVDISGSSYNAVFVGGNLNNVDVNIENCTYNGNYFGEYVSLVYGNPSSLSPTYSNPTISIKNVVNDGNLYGTNRMPLFAGSTGTTEPNSPLYSIDNSSKLGNIYNLTDNKLNIELDDLGHLVITKAESEVDKYVLTFTGGKRRISENSENSSYSFSINLGNIIFDNSKCTLEKYMDGKLATISQYNEMVDSKYIFDEENAITVYSESGARFNIVENNATIYYVFDFDDDFYFFANSNNESQIVDINSVSVRVYNSENKPIAQKNLKLN